jgi:chromosome segregation ATPase
VFHPRFPITGHGRLPLDSFVSGPSTSGRLLRVPSLSSPSPSIADVPETPIARARHPRQSVPTGKAAALSLRDQEKALLLHQSSHTLQTLTPNYSTLTPSKRNFNIKLRVHFLKERLAQLAPDQIDTALKQNIDLQIEVQQRDLEIKKLVLELERELERLQHGSAREHDQDHRHQEHDRDLVAQLQERERDPEMQFEDREHEIMELRRAQDSAERNDDDTIDHNASRHVRELDRMRAENEELRRQLEERDQLLIQREDEVETLTDHADRLQLEIEDIQRRRDAESIERSESRAQILEEREEREAVEDDLNAIRDKLAAATIELQQKEDELDLKNREIDDLIQEHDRVVEVVEQEWRGEAEEARSQVEELRDVCSYRSSSFLCFISTVL